MFKIVYNLLKRALVTLILRVCERPHYASQACGFYFVSCRVHACLDTATLAHSVGCYRYLMFILFYFSQYTTFYLKTHVIPSSKHFPSQSF